MGHPTINVSTPAEVSLIISTYNRPDALRLCLLSAFRQVRLPDEIIIGDDGSSSKTKELIETLRGISPVKLIHVWQEDNGFRLAAIRNKCIAKAEGDYIVQIDGDIIMHPYFIKDHLDFAEPGYYLRGGRANLSKDYTQMICGQGKLPRLSIFSRAYQSKRENAIHFPFLGRILMSRYRKRSLAFGCNMSFFRSDAIAINGYDEHFEGWGREDSDFSRRLLISGLKRRRLKFVANVFHLWHKEQSRANVAANTKYYLRENPPAKCQKGLDQYLNH